MFDENEHPRNDDGKFTEKGGASTSEKTVEAVRKYSDDPAHDLKEMGLPSHDLDALMGEEFKGVKGQAAIDKLMKERRGHVKAAFHRDDIGDIDLLWGSDTVGLKHILKRREEQGVDANEFVKGLTETIENGRLYRRTTRGDYEFVQNRKLAVIAVEYHGKQLTYLLTAYKTRQK